MDLKERIDDVVEGAVRDNRIVGSVTLVAKHGELVYARSAGWLDREAGVPMPIDAVFRLASVTKPMVAATALAMVERNLLGLDNAVSDHLPNFRPKLADGREAHITVRQLLTHTSGLVSDYAADPAVHATLTNTDWGFDEFLARLGRLPLTFEPGTGWAYGLSIDVLGAVIATIHGSTLAEAVAHYVTGPLAMKDTGFVPPEPSRLAVPYADGPPGLRRMADPDVVVAPDGGRTAFSPGRIFNPKAFQSGGAGAVGTAQDVLTFLETLRNGGDPILRPETVEMGMANQIGDLPRENAGQRFGFFGAVIDDPVAADTTLSRGSVRWGGAYGHEWSIDPEAGITIVSMTNTPYEGCSGNYRFEVRDAVYGRRPGQ